MNKKLFKVQMVLHDDTQESLADAIGVSRGTMNQKINETNGRNFDQDEIRKLIDRWNLVPEEVVTIFFSDDVA